MHLSPGETLTIPKKRDLERDRLSGTSLCALASLSSFHVLSMMLLVIASPNFEKFFNVTTSQARFPLIFFSLGASFGQIFWGVFSDFQGRKVSFYGGVFFFFLGSAFSIFFNHFFGFCLGTFLQGLSCSGFPTLARAISRDFRSGDALQRLIALLTLSPSLTAACVVFFGQDLLLLFRWSDIFPILSLLLIPTIIFIRPLLGERRLSKKMFL